MAARMRLVAGPARATSTDWFRGWRSRLMLTGTGLAQPKMGLCVRASTTGTRIDPTGSMCLIGLRVSRPARLAVSSPHQRATTPWLTSWRITAGKNTRMKMSVSSLITWWRMMRAIRSTPMAAKIT